VSADGIDALKSQAPLSLAPMWSMEAIAHHKHIILMNAELDGTVGPILKGVC